MHTTNYTTKNGLKKASRRATPSLSIVHNYVSAFTNNKPDPTPCMVIYSLGAVAVFRHAQDFVWQFTVLHVANCHDKIWWTMSDYFPVYWFWATVCASTRDNRYNCALPTQGRRQPSNHSRNERSMGIIAYRDLYLMMMMMMMMNK